MHRILAYRYLLVTALIGSAALGQTPNPTFTYTLHAGSQRWGAYTPRLPANEHPRELDLLPDNSLLELIPQGHERWVLKRLSGWDTPKPREESLWIKTGRSEVEDVHFDAELLINPAATYALAIIQSSSGDTQMVDIHPQLVVVVVDLRTFQVAKRLETSSYLFRLGSWKFVPSGKVILRDLDSHKRWTLAVHQLPSLDRLAECQYEKETGVQDADRRCAGALQAAEIATIASFDAPDAPSSESAVGDELGKVPDCVFGGATPDGRYGYYDCSTSRLTLWDTLKTTSRRMFVLETQTRRTIIDMRLPTRPDFAFALVESRGQNYLLLLREAVKFQAYRLP